MYIKKYRRYIYTSFSGDGDFSFVPLHKGLAKDVLFVYNISVTEKMTAWFGNAIDEKKEEREEAV